MRCWPERVVLGPRLVAGKVKLSGAKNSAGAGADAEVTSVVAGMVAGADGTDDLDVLRHGAIPATDLA
ncbi:hypothetical protein ACF08M_06790 [Streptomyces sp. NPDC015032]|uniref:hypothetical protein n=1 Tax=Streptomyces sp. NPDC015032 TaxID=3364937 RepID=UPI0037015E23